MPPVPNIPGDKRMITPSFAFYKMKFILISPGITVRRANPVELHWNGGITSLHANNRQFEYNRSQSKDANYNPMKLPAQPPETYSVPKSFIKY